MPFLIWPPGQVLGMYKIEDFVDVPSPDDRYIATGFHVLGSAIVHDTVVVQLRLGNERYDAKNKDSLFILDDTSSSHSFNLSWASDNELVVTYTPGSIYLQKFSWKDVTIKYIPK
jgi:hypothetical protein